MTGSKPIILTARDIMTTSLITFRPETGIFEAIRTLISKGVSGAPVVNEAGKLVGVLSELDCLRTLSSDEFYNGQQEESATVMDFMTPAGDVIGPDTGIYVIAHHFLTKPLRRFPVVDRDRLVGLVSRRDVLRGIDEMSKKRLQRKRYPDYREPA